MSYLTTYLIIALISWPIFAAIGWKDWRTIISAFFLAILWPSAHIMLLLVWWKSADCAWCGEHTTRDKNAIREHILRCEKHPMRSELEELQRYRLANGKE